MHYDGDLAQLELIRSARFSYSDATRRSDRGQRLESKNAIKQRFETSLRRLQSMARSQFPQIIDLASLLSLLPLSITLKCLLYKAISTLGFLSLRSEKEMFLGPKPAMPWQSQDWLIFTLLSFGQLKRLPTSVKQNLFLKRLGKL